ncbi:MAG: SDR family oxidoreductase [Actinomycetota bacterium]|nr:SDR family oxidoreductase [Actinomycetota bacterium]
MNHRIALITGASRGLGLALARDLAGAGWSLVVDGRGDVALAAAARVVAVAGVADDDDHRRLLVDAVDELGGLDALVHNASILGPSPQPAWPTTPSTSSSTSMPSTWWAPWP